MYFLLFKKKEKKKTQGPSRYWDEWGQIRFGGHQTGVPLKELGNTVKITPLR